MVSTSIKPLIGIDLVYLPTHVAVALSSGSNGHLAIPVPIPGKDSWVDNNDKFAWNILIFNIRLIINTYKCKSYQSLLCYVC